MCIIKKKKKTRHFQMAQVLMAGHMIVLIKALRVKIIFVMTTIDMRTLIPIKISPRLRSHSLYSSMFLLCVFKSVSHFIFTCSNSPQPLKASSLLWSLPWLPPSLGPRHSLRWGALVNCRLSHDLGESQFSGWSLRLREPGWRICFSRCGVPK